MLWHLNLTNYHAMFFFFFNPIVNWSFTHLDLGGYVVVFMLNVTLKIFPSFIVLWGRVMLDLGSTIPRVQVCFPRLSLSLGNNGLVNILIYETKIYQHISMSWSCFLCMKNSLINLNCRKILVTFIIAKVKEWCWRQIYRLPCSRPISLRPNKARKCRHFQQQCWHKRTNLFSMKGGS